MPAVDLSAAADQLLASNSPLISLQSWLADYIEGNTPSSDLEASELAQDAMRRLTRIIDDRLESARRRRVLVPFRWLDDETKTELEHVGAYSDALEALEERLAWRGQLREVLRQLDWREFEYLALHLLDLYGIPKQLRRVTPGSNEGGIDFYGLEETDPDTTNRIRRQRFRIVGQAKRYAGAISSDEMDMFAWRLLNFRLGTGRRWLALEDWFLNEGDEPIFGMFITSGRYSESALATANSALVISIDGEQIAQDLSESPASERWLNPETRVVEIDRVRSFLTDASNG